MGVEQSLRRIHAWGERWGDVTQSVQWPVLAPSPATVINGVSLRICLRVRRSREEHVAAATALSKLYKLHHHWGSGSSKRICAMSMRDVSYLSRCLDDVLMCGQRRAVVLTGAHGYNLLMTKILFETPRAGIR